MAEKRAIPRRTVLAQAAGSAAFLSLGAWAGGSRAVAGAVTHGPSRAPQSRRTVMLDRVSASEFAPHLGSRFALEGSPEGVTDLELFKAEGLGYRSVPGGEAAATREPFSLLFRGPEGSQLPQGIYTLVHESLGRVELFLVPIGPGRQGGALRYEAIFG